MCLRNQRDSHWSGDVSLSFLVATARRERRWVCTSGQREEVFTPGVAKVQHWFIRSFLMKGEEGGPRLQKAFSGLARWSSVKILSLYCRGMDSIPVREVPPCGQKKGLSFYSPSAEAEGCCEHWNPCGFGRRVAPTPDRTSSVTTPG